MPRPASPARAPEHRRREHEPKQRPRTADITKVPSRFVGHVDPPALRYSPRLFARATVALPLVGLALGVILLVLGLIVLGCVVAVLSVVIGAANLFLGSPKHIVEAIESRRATEESDSRLLNIVLAKCLANGITPPSVRVKLDESPNAVLIGSSLERATLVCSSGLLGLLDRIELEGVVARELAGLKRGDAVVFSSLTRAFGTLVALFPSWNWVIARLSGWSLASLVDQAGVAMTRYPPGLASALEKIASSPSTRPSGLSRHVMALTAHAWLVPLRNGHHDATHIGELDVLSRIDLLREL